MVQYLRDRLANIARTAARSEAARLQDTIVVMVEAAAGRLRQSVVYARFELARTLSAIPSEEQTFVLFQCQECGRYNSEQHGLNANPFQPHSVCALGSLTNSNVTFNSLLYSFSSLSKISACRLNAS